MRGPRVPSSAVSVIYRSEPADSAQLHALMFGELKGSETEAMRPAGLWCVYIYVCRARCVTEETAGRMASKPVAQTQQMVCEALPYACMHVDVTCMCMHERPRLRARRRRGRKPSSVRTCGVSGRSTATKAQT